jgi:hypothetical protein
MYDLNVFTFEDNCHKSVIIKIILKPSLHSWSSAVGLEFQYMCKRSFYNRMEISNDLVTGNLGTCLFLKELIGGQLFSWLTRKKPIL